MWVVEVKVTCHKLTYPFTPGWLVVCPCCGVEWEAESGEGALGIIRGHVDYHVEFLSYT